MRRPHVLREYALLADGERGILIGPSGEMAWMCFPGWADDGLFSTLIGGLGSYAVTPSRRFVWGGSYEPGSLIWRSRWVIEDDAILEAREALVLPARTDRAVILRRLTALEGSGRLDVELHPRSGFGSHPLSELRRRDDGGWEGRTGDVRIGWWGAEHARPTADGGMAVVIDLEEGATHDLVLVASCEEIAEAPDADRCWSATQAAWQERVPELGLAVAGRDARHAWAVLNGLTGRGGGMVAAATTALPERAYHHRSFDYRYVWIRDQAYAGRAVAKVGPYELLDGAVGFIRDRLLEDGPQMAPAYTASGGRVPDEQELDLPGYPGGAAIVGNWVNGQFQLDAFGEALLLFATAADHDRIDSDTWRAAEIAAETIEQRWREPDAGIWELEPDEWAESRLLAAAGLRAISGSGSGGEQAARWLALADAIVADTSARAVHPSGRWQRSPKDTRVDAALLLPALRGAIPADDPRSAATFAAVLEELTEDGYVYRYRPDGRPLGEAEGSFLFCGFLVVLSYLQRGDRVGAARWFERTRASCGPPGLLSEEYDVRQRQLRGNLPQAFVHALLLECALEQDRLQSGT